MAGFPIVSLGSLVGSYNACEVLIPQFEIDDYYMGDEAIGKQAWSGRYPTAMSAGYIKSINVYPNNIYLEAGEESSIVYSCGFTNGFPGSSIYYSTGIKEFNITNIRFDGFYTKYIKDYFYYFLRDSSKTFEVVNNMYINLPNLLEISRDVDFYFQFDTTNIYLNVPKTLRMNNYTFAFERKLQNINLNAPLLRDIAYGQFRYMYPNVIKVNATDENTIVELTRLFTENVYIENGTPLIPIFEEGVLLNLSAFDLRYWSKYENETGLDVGLLEGSNLR